MYNDWKWFIQTVHEPCVYDSDCNGNNCVTQSASSAGVCKLLLGGADCWIDSDCEFNHCQTSQAIGVLGSCTCNPTTTSGCNGRETCYSADEQDLATSIVDVGPRCLLPVGATCTDAAEFFTEACASIDGSGTNKEFVCSSTNYPCPDGKACVNGTCQVSTATQPSTCPQVPEDNFCFQVREPLKCGECCYSNSCRATAAAATFSTVDTSTCATPADGECPQGLSI